MEDSLLFFTGLFCFVLAIIGAILTIKEFKELDSKE
tara:strand:- start:480 stop:587 length:108 start_codon:yes stop_codon:yes gene_type:complete